MAEEIGPRTSVSYLLEREKIFPDLTEWLKYVRPTYRVSNIQVDDTCMTLDGCKTQKGSIHTENNELVLLKEQECKSDNTSYLENGSFGQNKEVALQRDKMGCLENEQRDQNSNHPSSTVVSLDDSGSLCLKCPCVKMTMECLNFHMKLYLGANNKKNSEVAMKTTSRNKTHVRRSKRLKIKHSSKNLIISDSRRYKNKYIGKNSQSAKPSRVMQNKIINSHCSKRKKRTSRQNNDLEQNIKKLRKSAVHPNPSGKTWAKKRKMRTSPKGPVNISSMNACGSGMKNGLMLLRNSMLLSFNNLIGEQNAYIFKPIYSHKYNLRPLESRAVKYPVMLEKVSQDPLDI